jgi:hypothetical protein
MGARDMKHNRDEKLNAKHFSAVQRAAGLRRPCRFDSEGFAFCLPLIEKPEDNKSRYVCFAPHIDRRGKENVKII